MIWFTSDLHLSHNKILVHCHETRGRFCTPEDAIQAQEMLAAGTPKKFMASKESIENMDSFLIDQINSKVSKKDTLWILGDFSFATDKKLEELFDRFVCKDIRITWGNHDRRNHVLKYCKFTQHHNAVTLYRFKNQRDILYNDSEVFDSKELRRALEKDFKATEKIYLSHYCSLVWPISKNCWHLYGHSHGGLTHPVENVPALDIGVDAVHKYGFETLSPVSLEQLDGFMKPRLEAFRKPVDG